MQIEAKRRSKWQGLYEYGDFTLIADKAESTVATIQRIVQGKPPYETTAPVRYVKVIDKFYDERKAEIKKLN